jgi:predicted nuclease with TOPRIM domain
MEQATSLRRQEEEASLSLAENKQQIHEELEAREAEVRRLQASLNSISVERDQLQTKGQLPHCNRYGEILSLKHI